ncbi:Uncharacterized protein OS=Sutterella sp. CAG:351 GN=BN620_02020 PE=4 SV=1: DUF3854 [Gemmata massiliana]|uniref:DUF3854 domain-containing protein n=1 Tax=Gemmata massiliana TaxID=1210884 RepID=A0A6P2D980_9BACT|nr:DUF3854 domain-containing protein [Gemmata massiliana]VTR97911.1 Uncharacterized protein OS=Sutterella sp. CAG:351 GN=BN620_02020 PE=4 SV=1: DUF3854 [Gemmata massiliana]
MSTKSSWRDATPTQPCVICEDTKWCRAAEDGGAVICRRAGTHPTYGTGVEKTDKSGARYFLFRTGPRAVSDAPAPIHSHTEGAANPASAEERDRVYRAFLKLLGSTGVGPALDSRGVPDDSRLRKWYRSLPLQGRAKICRRMIADGLEPLMARTPGFVAKTPEKGNPYWTFTGRPGLVIPVTDHAGRVVAIIVRPEPAGSGGKYLWFSSKKQGGAKCTQCVHAPRWKGDTGTVRLTEGVLKADVASELGGVLTVGMPGLSAKGIVTALRHLGAQTVRLALDADAATNTNVARAVVGHFRKLTRAGFTVELERWDAKDGKGVDDLLANNKTPELVTGPAVAEAIGSIGQSASEPDGSGRPIIRVTEKEGDVVRAVVAALAAGDHDLYQKDGELVAVVQGPGPNQSGLAPRIVPLTAPNIRTRITDAVTLCQLKNTPDGGQTLTCIAPPQWLAVAVKDLNHWPGVRPLVGITGSPVLRPDGTVHQEPGYDPATGLLYVAGDTFDPIPENPTSADAVAALGKLRAGVSQFPWQEPSDRAAWLAEVITVAVRHAIPGPVPGFFHTANAPSSGKTALVKASVHIGTGFEVPFESYPLTGRKNERSEDVEEIRKLATTCAIEAYPAFLLDNVPSGSNFGSSTMDAILTSTVNSGRQLGTNSAPRREATTVWFWTGNNIRPVADTVRRTVAVRLYSLEERPEEREYTGPNVTDWAQRNRGELFTAALTVAAAYIRAGRSPVGVKPMGSFEAWSELVRSALIWAGEADPCSARNEYVSEDTDRETIASLIALLVATKATGAGKTAAEIANAVADELNGSRPQFEKESTWVLRMVPSDLPMVAAYRAVFPHADRPDQNQLGYRLRKYKGRIVDGKRVTRVGETARGKVALWAVVDAGMPQNASPADSRGDAGNGARAGIAGEDDPHIPYSESLFGGQF